MSDTQLDHGILDAHLADLLTAPRWYVAFSGGVDSTVLLHLLHGWCKAHREAPPLTAIHVNHALQASADDWQLHCQWMCKMLRIPVVCLPADVRPGAGGPEAAAREARYRVFKAQMGAEDVLFLGHHLDDQVETFFLRLMRGGGVRGLAAMPAVRQLGRGRLARPLLQTSRASLEHYARSHGLQFVEDPSNSDVRLDRNFLRAQLLPLLASRWPGYRGTVARAAAHIAGASAVLEQTLPAPVTVHSAMGDPGVAVTELLDLEPEGAAVKLRHWLQEAGCLLPDRALLDEFLRQLRESAEHARPRLQCSAFTLQRYREGVYLLPPDSGACAPFQLGPGECYEIPGAGELGLEPARSDGLLLAAGESVAVSWRRGGERCKPVGRAGGNSLKKLLQERDIPPWWRNRVPLLYLNGELLAVGDLWLCESSRWRRDRPAGQSLWRPRWERHKHAAFD